MNDASKEKVISDYFLSGAGYLSSYSFALPEKSNRPVYAVNHFRGEYSGGGAQGATELTFALSNNNTLENAWIKFTVPQGSIYIPADGQYSCADNQCVLDGTIITNIPEFGDHPYFRKGDRVVLNRSPDGWSGQIKSQSHEVFEGQKEEVKYNINLSNETRSK